MHIYQCSNAKKKYWPLQWLGLLELIFKATFLTDEFQIGICPNIKNFWFHWNTCPMCPLRTLTALNRVIKTLFFTNSTRIHLTIYSLLFRLQFFWKMFFFNFFLIYRKYTELNIFEVLLRKYILHSKMCVYTKTWASNENWF